MVIVGNVLDLVPGPGGKFQVSCHGFPVSGYQTPQTGNPKLETRNSIFL
jgi:hypothetical protein